MSIRFVRKNPWSLLLGFAVLGAACSDPVDVPDPPIGEFVEVSGVITEDATWSGNILVVEDVTIAAGITVTIEPGTWLQAAQGTFVRSEGSLVLAGTESDPISIYPMDGAPSWGGFTAEAGGSVDMQHVRGEHVSAMLFCKSGAEFCRMSFVHIVNMGNAIVTNADSLIENSYFENMANAGISVGNGSDLTITDTYILTSDHDLIVTTAGSRLTVDHSEIGGAQGSYEHCNFHIGAADYVSITNSNLISSIYSIMIGNTNNAVIQYNNIVDNDNDIQEVGANTNVDLRYNYWSNGAPSLGAVYDTSSPEAEYIEAAGPRS